MRKRIKKEFKVEEKVSFRRTMPWFIAMASSLIAVALFGLIGNRSDSILEVQKRLQFIETQNELLRQQIEQASKDNLVVSLSNQLMTVRTELHDAQTNAAYWSNVVTKLKK